MEAKTCLKTIALDMKMFANIFVVRAQLKHDDFISEQELFKMWICSFTGSHELCFAAL